MIFELSSSCINDFRNTIIRHLRQSRIYNAIELIKTLVTECGCSTFLDEYNHIFDSYKYMLEYFTRGFADPNRQQQIENITEDLYTLTDKLTLTLMSRCSTKLFYIRYNNRIGNVDEKLQQYSDIIESIEYGKQNSAEYTDSDNYLSLINEREKIEKDIFHYFWVTFPSSKSDVLTLRHILLEDSSVPFYFRCQILGAMLLSLLTFFDKQKILLLIDVYEQYEDCEQQELQEIALRAITCLIIALFRHNRRTASSKELARRISLLAEGKNFSTDIANIFISLVKEKNAANLSQSLQNSIIPDIMKIAPDIIDNAMKNNGVIDISSLEENPDWQNIFDKSGLSKKIEEFSKLQTSGDDVFLSTFSHLKNYTFFKELYNWFRPYQPDCSSLIKAFRKMNTSVKTLIDGASYLCDNDKYSFVLSLSELNDSQREIMLQQFDMRGNELNEHKDELKKNVQRDNIVNHYLKDLYRFFNIYSRRTEFPNIFQSSLDFISIDLLRQYFLSPSLISSVAEIYFKAKNYATAAEYYEQLAMFPDKITPIYLQKLGFARQNLGDTELALKCYLKYSFVDDNDIWNLKHIVYCYRTLGKYDKAIEYLHKAIAIQPSNTSLTLVLGHCYAESKQFELALKEYYKAEYLDDKSHSAWRPLAWCLFMTRDYTKSRKYYTLIFNEDTPKENDYLNFGHLCLVEGKFEEAISYYYNAYSALGNNINKFVEKWQNDIPSLKFAGMKELDADLLLDAIMIKIKE